MKISLVLILFCHFSYCAAQKLVEQTIFRGAIGVYAVKSTENSIINLLPGKTIKKAWLISGNQNDNLLPDTFYVKTTVVNGINFFWDENAQSTQRVQNQYLLNGSSVYKMEVTNALNTSTTLIENEVMTFPSGENPNQRFYCMALVVLYEDNTMPEMNFSLWLNDLVITRPQVHNYSNVNPINNTYPVSFSLMTGHIIDTLDDGSYIKVNGVDLGIIGEAWYNENNGDYSAPIGQFIHQNNTGIALSNDSIDLEMHAGDALADISSITTNNSTNITGEYTRVFQWGGVYLEQTNVFWATFLAYTTPCTSFPVTTPKDTTICQGTTLQLNATGGTPNSHSTSGYEWQPATGLSCTDCPNPVFAADSSMFYTVRIWNTDSCSVVRPLKINVRKAPVWDTATVQPTVCGASTGSVTLFASPNNMAVKSWTEVSGNTQISNTFQNLSGGNHTFNFTNTFGCQSADTTLFIPNSNATQAGFTANPRTGAAPLSVNFTNTSQNATDYLWSVNGTNFGNSLQNYLFDTTGIYFVELIAWQNDPSCADTFSIQISAFDSLVLQIPNVFSPNGDSVNDFYTLESNVPVSVHYSIYNRWGETMVENTVKFGPGKTVLWDGFIQGNQASDGTYFYQLEATPTFDGGVVGETLKLSGFLQMVR